MRNWIMSINETHREYTEGQIDSAINVINDMVTEGYEEAEPIDNFYIDSINNFGQVFSKQLKGLDPEPMSFVVTKIGVTTKDENENVQFKEIDVYVIYSGKYWYLANPEYDAEETLELFTTIEHMLDNPDEYKEDIAFGLQPITVTHNAG